jgi:putative membrane protein
MILATSLLLSLITPLATYAHGGEGLTADAILSSWNFTPDIVILTLLGITVYLRGMARRKQVINPIPPLRHVLFFSGVAVVFLALESPLDPLAERLFLMHQIQHIMLRMLGPMLITLSGPEGILIAGLPRFARQYILAPVVSNRAVQACFRFLTHPLVAFVVFLASLYIWQIPRVHNAALENDALHYVMHISMLAAGMMFFWLIFDRRPPPQSLKYKPRLLMLVGVIVSNMLIGAVTTLKSTVLYTAYGINDRLFNLPPLVDETIGGFILWVPSSMMCIIAILIALHGWGKDEQRAYLKLKSRAWSGSNSAALELPQTAEELRIKVKVANRGTALTLVAVYLTMLVGAVTVAISVHILSQ